MRRKLPRVQVGEVFGRLTVSGQTYPLGRYIQVPVLCSCGSCKTVSQDNLRSGRLLSCGCLRDEIVSRNNRTHGMSETPVYAIWNMMRQRCQVPTYKQYADYGGRGLHVCEDWQTFEGFYKAVGQPPFKGATLERLNNELGYYKENVVWANRKTQARNKRTTRYINYKGQERKLVEVCAELGIRYGMVSQRLNTYGWSVEAALTPSTKSLTKPTI